MILEFLITATLALLPTGVETPFQDTCRTLEECIETGISEGFEVRRLKVDLPRAEEVSKLSVLDILPAGEVSAGHEWQFTGKIAGTVSSFTFSAGAGLSANAVAEGIFIIKGAGAEVIRSRAALDEAVLGTALEITQEYLRLLLAMQSCKNADSSLSAIKLLREKTATEVEVGKSSRGTLAEIEAQVASERAELVKAQGEIRSAAMALAESMNLSPQSKISVLPPPEGYIPSVSDLPDEAQIHLYIENHPSLKAADASLESALQQRRAALVGLYPQIRLGVDYVGEGKKFMRNGTPAMNLGVTIPIADGSARLRQARNSKSQVRTKQLEIEAVRRKLEIEIRGEILEAVSSWENYTACEENLNAMLLSFHICEAKFEAGAISGSDYITSRKNYLNALAQYWQARYNYIFRMKCISIRMNHESLPKKISL